MLITTNNLIHKHRSTAPCLSLGDFDGYDSDALVPVYPVCYAILAGHYSLLRDPLKCRKALRLADRWDQSTVLVNVTISLLCLWFWPPSSLSSLSFWLTSFSLSPSQIIFRGRLLSSCKHARYPPPYSSDCTHSSQLSPTWVRVYISRQRMFQACNAKVCVDLMWLFSS